MYCDGCGASQKIVESNPVAPTMEDSPLDIDSAQAESKKAPHKKKLIKSIALVLVSVFIVGILVSILFPAKETVYVLTEIRCVSAYDDTERVLYECEMEYDKFGNPLCSPDLYFVNDLVWNGQVSNEYGSTELEYDSHGNPTYISDNQHEFVYTYDILGRIQTCEEFDSAGETYAVWEYKWDVNGRLIQVVSDLEEGWDQIVRADFEYDWQGRLIKEFFFYIRDESLFEDLREEGFIDICAIEYQYDHSGNLETISSGWSKGHDCFDMKLSEIDIDVHEIYRLGYDDNQISEIEYISTFAPIHLDQSDYDHDIEWAVKEFEYDRQGNLEPSDDDYPYEFEYDKHGNLTRIDTNRNTYWECEYEEVRLTNKASERYYRWERMLYMDVDSLYLGLQNISFKARHPNFDKSIFCMYFYYLMIPNPLW